MNVVILQPSYMPWRGYFHQIYKADIFVFYDDVQYDKHGWRNRNRIKTPMGPQWLTIPVFSKGNLTNNIPINEIKICWDKAWNKKHWMTIKNIYSKAPYYQQYAPMLEEIYYRRPLFLADFTIDLTISLAKVLGIEKTIFLRSSTLSVSGNKSDRLIRILKTLGAKHYITGPSAENYIEHEKFYSAGIGIEYIDYNYPEYTQLYSPFEPKISIIDLLFMTGPSAPQYIWK